jgi:hypothetical protein
MTFKNVRKTIDVAAAFLMATLGICGVLAAHASAAGLQSTYVRLDRMKASTATTFRVVIKVPTGNSATEAHLKVTVPDSFTVATTGLTATGTAGCDASATALPGTLTATGSNTNGSKGVDIGGVTNLTAGTTYCADVDKTSTHDPITTPAAGQYTATVTTQTSAPADIDTTDVALRVISDDQVLVSAAVPPSFTFVLDSNSTSFTNTLDSSNVRQTTGRTVTITTNAANGWITWAKDANTGLTSPATGKTIASKTPGTATSLSAGTENYLVSAEVTTDAANGGTVSIPTAYQGTSGNNNGSGLDTTYRMIASSTGTAGGSGDVITVRGKAAVAADTPAANDYADTWTIIGAGTF